MAESLSVNFSITRAQPADYGDAPMPHTLRLTNGSVSIHGSNVRWGFATHGCVGVPKAFAAKLFDVVSGDEVLIVSGKPRRARRVNERDLTPCWPMLTLGRNGRR